MEQPALGTTPPARRGVLLTTATLAQFGVSMTQQGTVILGVFFAAAYHLTLPQMGAVVSALTLGLVVSGLINGTLVDRFGSRRVLFIGTLVVAAAATAIGLIHQLVPTMALLFLLGIALGVVPLTGTKAVLMAWPMEQRGLPMGVRQMGVPAGALVAALTLPALATRLGLHPLYLGLALLMALAGLSFCAVLPRYTPAPKGQRRAAVSLRAELPQVILPSICGFLMAWGQYSLATYTIPFLHGRDGISIGVAGALLALAQIGGGGARMVLGHISDRLGGRRDMVLFFTALGAALLACLLAVLPTHLPVIILGLLWFVLGVTMVGWNALMLTWTGERVSVEHAGAAIGVTTSSILLGATATAPIFGLIVTLSGGYRMAWLTLALLLAIAALLLGAQTRHSAQHVAAAPAEPALAAD